MLKKICSTALILTATALYLGVIQPAKALQITPKTNFNIDLAAEKQESTPNLPNSIVIAPIFQPEGLIFDDSEWYEGIYYYTAARLGQGDFLSHYFLTADGVILEGNSGKDEHRFYFADGAQKPVVITYLARSGQTDFAPAAKPILQELILDIANRNAIPLKNIQARSLSYQLKPEEPISLKTDIISGLWEISIRTALDNITPAYRPQTKAYDLKVEKVEVTKDKVSYGDTVTMQITVKNVSENILYQGTDYEPLMARNSKEASKFFINGTWLSQTQAPVMTEETYLKPGEAKTFGVKLGVPLFFGLQKESFSLTNQMGTKYPGTDFEIALDIARTDKQVIEITATETGQLNVRDGPWASSSVISRVTPGQRFFVLERTETGYVKLDLGNGKTGWVVSKYTKVV